MLLSRDSLSAVCSSEVDDPIYRYSYTRTRWAGRKTAAVILHNPVHRGNEVDPTTGRCMTWLCSDGTFGEVIFVNLFAYRHRDPLALIGLARAGVDVIGPRNDEVIEAVLARVDLVVAAWGANPPRIAPERSSVIMSMIERPYCFGVNLGGSPIHPNRRGNDMRLTCRPYLGNG